MATTSSQSGYTINLPAGAGGAGSSGSYLIAGGGAGGGSTWPTGSVTIANNGGSYTTTATNWTTQSINFNSTTGKTLMSIPNGEDKLVLEKTATLDVKGNIRINGIDLEERLKTIEKVLMIPERDAKLEAKYPKLKKLYDDYINALGKYRTFDSIKGDE